MFTVFTSLQDARTIVLQNEDICVQ